MNVGRKSGKSFAKPFDTPEAVYQNLSRYVYQVAISNHQLEKVEEGQVTYADRDLAKLQIWPKKYPRQAVEGSLE